MIVVDASCAAAWLLPDESSAGGTVLLQAILRGREELAVPQLWSYELTNLLLSAHRRGRIAEDAVFAGQALLGQVPHRVYEHQDAQAQRRMSRLALQYALSAYDAAYLELADRLRCPLHTLDRALRKAASSVGLPT